MGRRILIALLCALVLPHVVWTADDGLGWEVTDAGWVKTLVVLGPDDDCPNGIQMGAADTQTDVKRRWPDGNIEQAIVAFNAADTGNYLPSCGSASGAVFGTPTNPADTSVVLTQRANPTLLTVAHFSIAKSGTHDNAVTRFYRIACDDNAGNISFPSAQPRSITSNTTLDATNKVVITWTSGVPATASCTDVRVYRGTSSGTEEQICDTTRTTLSCDDTGQAASGAWPTSTDDDPGTAYTFALPAFAVGSGYLVNGVEAVGQTTISADTGTGGIAKGDEVSFGAATQQYLVTSTLAAGTFTIYPALIAEAADNAAIVVHDWAKGQHLWERRFVVKADNAGDIQDLMEVWFDVEHYSDGDCRVDVAVNYILDRADLVPMAYDVTINVQNVAVYTKDFFPHVFGSRWRKKFDCAGWDTSNWKEDFTAHKAAKLIPTYYADIVNTVYDAPSGAAYDIGGFGGNNKAMADPGYRHEIGYLTTEQAQYTIHKSDSQRALVLAQGNISGTWRGHLTKADGGTITRTDIPNYWARFGPAGICTGAAAPDGIAFCTTTTTVQYPMALYVEQFGWENAHLPNLNQLPYLMTGDRWHLDQLRFWGHMSTLTSPNNEVVEGTFLASSNEARGIAWGMRSIFTATAHLPDNDYDMPEFALRLDLNMDAINALVEDNDLNIPFQGFSLANCSAQELIDDELWSCYQAPWQYGYMTHVLEWIDAHDAIRDNNWDRTKLTHLLTHQMRFCSGGDDVPYLYCGQHQVEVGVMDAEFVQTWYDEFPGDFFGRPGWPTDPATPSDSGTDLTIDASNNKLVTFDNGIALQVDQAIQITGGGCTVGYYRIHSQFGGSWVLDRSPGATSTSGCDWTKRSNHPSLWLSAGGGGENVAPLHMADSLVTVDLAKRESMAGASDAFDAISVLTYNTPGNTHLFRLKNATEYISLAIDYADPDGGEPSPSGVGRYRLRFR